MRGGEGWREWMGLSKGATPGSLRGGGRVLHVDCGHRHMNLRVIKLDIAKHAQYK